VTRIFNTETFSMNGARRRGAALVLIAATLWSSGGLGIKLVRADPLAIAGFRSFFALLVLTTALIWSARRDLGGLTWCLRRKYVWIGGAFYALTMTTFVMANKMTTAANAILLQYTAPIFVAFIAWPLLKEPVKSYDWAAIGGCLFGMTWFFLGKLTPTGLNGNLLAIVAGVGFAGLTVFIRLNLKTALAENNPPASAGLHLAGVAMIVLGNGLTALVCLPWMTHMQTQTAAGWMTLAGLGIFQIGVAYLFFAAGVGRLAALESTILAMVEPILSPVWVAIGDGERPSGTALVGGTIVIGVIIVRGIVVARLTASGDSGPNR
jgi:drug/metabolite transporter (DMT)-like permease